MIELGKERELEPTPAGYRCVYLCHDAGLVVIVQERKLRFDAKRKQLAAYWHRHGAVEACLITSRAAAQAVVEHHVRYFDTDLVATLAPIWAEWDAVPAEALPETEGAETAAGPLN